MTKFTVTYKKSLAFLRTATVYNMKMKNVEYHSQNEHRGGGGVVMGHHVREVPF